MKRTQGGQLTIRDVPGPVHSRLRETARREGRSLNAVAVEALRRGVGLGSEEERFSDLDDLAGTWQEDPAFDRAIAEMDRVDESCGSEDRGRHQPVPGLLRRGS